jgi:HlyD family secretion protein
MTPASRLSRAAWLALLVSAAAPAIAEGPVAAPPPPDAPSISVVKARTGELVASTVVTGTLTPRETVTVGADVEGLRIEELFADEGDRVAKGQVLARLATDIVDVDIAQAEAKLARAEAAITQSRAVVDEAQSAQVEAAAALERARSLSGKGIVGQDILDARVSAAAAANARLASAQQGIALAEADRASAEAERREFLLRRSKAEIKAPTDGLVLQREARLGAIVSSAGGALFELARGGEIELDAAVSETALGRLQPGQPATVSLGGAATVEGRVRLVSPRVDRATRLGSVRVTLDPSPLLRSGAFARASIETARADGLVVPRSAVVSTGTRDTIQVVREGRIETREVKLGVQSGADVEVTEGLAAGDEVVATAGTFVRDGDAVRPIPAEAVETAEAAR